MSEISDEMIDAAFRVFKGEMLMYEEDRSLIERMLRAALSQGQDGAVGVKVKHLEWKRTTNPPGFEADTPIARAYRIDELAGSDSPSYETSGGGSWTLLYEGDDLPSAKSAAQADYEARILSALAAPAQEAPEEITRCTICGFVVDTRYAAEKPEGFGTAGRTKASPSPAQEAGATVSAAILDDMDTELSRMSSVITSRELIERTGGDPDAPFERGPFPLEMRHFPAQEAGAEPVAWPAPKIVWPDIANPTGVAYIDCLLHRLLDAQQDINFEANARMSQSLCDASALIDEIEVAIRRLAASPNQGGGNGE